MIQCPLRVLTATDIASGKSSLQQQPGRFLPSRPTGGWENRLKGIVESIVLSGGVTCRQKCPDYSSPCHVQLSGTCLWLSKKRGWGNNEKVSKQLYAALPRCSTRIFQGPRATKISRCQGQSAIELGLSFQKPSSPLGTIILED